MTIELTEEQRAVLDHQCREGADAWIAGALAGALAKSRAGNPERSPGEHETAAEALARGHMLAKVERYRPAYERAKTEEGPRYRNRRARDIEELKALRDNPKLGEVERSMVTRRLSDLEAGVMPVRLSQIRAQRAAAATGRRPPSTA